MTEVRDHGRIFYIHEWTAVSDNVDVYAISTNAVV